MDEEIHITLQKEKNKLKRAKRKKKFFNNDESPNTNTKTEGKNNITPRGNNPSKEMNTS